MQHTLNIHCLGPEGSNAHEVASGVCLPGRFVFAGGNFEALRALAEDGNPDSFAVVPIENSVATVGLVADVAQFWLGAFRGEYPMDVRVIGERYHRVEHCFAGKPGSAEADLFVSAVSHPQGLSQCSAWIRRSGYQPVPALSTAAAAQSVSESGFRAGAGAICSPFAARRYGLAIVAHGIADQEDNQTRFHLVGRKFPAPTGQDRMGLLFELDDRPNSLASALNVFGVYGINLSTLHSLNLGSGRYAFYVEAECHEMDERGSAVIASLRVVAKPDRLAILGSYPREVRPQEGGAR